MMDTGRIVMNMMDTGRVLMNIMDTGRIVIYNEYNGYWQDSNE